jgi:hypothetical protein
MKGILAAAALVGLAAGTAVSWPALLPLPEGTVRGVGAGVLLGVAGSVGGVWLLVWNLRAGHTRFLVAFFGGTLGRLVLFALVLVLVVRGGELPVGSFLAGLIPGYLGFQAAEMLYLHRSTRDGTVGVERRA